MINLGNVVGLVKSTTPPTKTYVLWGKILNENFPDIVDILHYDSESDSWISITSPSVQYWLRPVIEIRESPPLTVNEGDRYLVADANASGPFLNREDQVAYFKGGAWQFIVPLDGMILTVRAEANKLYDFRGTYNDTGSWEVYDFQVPFDASQYIEETQKGIANGVATLDGNVFIPLSQIDVDNLTYNPETPGDWNTTPSTIKEALDLLITLVNIDNASNPVLTVDGQSPDGSGNVAINKTTDNDITIQVDVPEWGYSKGEVIGSGTSLEEFIIGLVSKLFTPTLIAPSFQLNKDLNTLQKIGASLTINLTFAFGRGLIRGDLVSGVWDENATQDFRAGAEIEFTIQGNTQPGNTYQEIFSVISGDNVFNGTVDYGIGPQPLDSEGNNFDSPLPAGTSPIQETKVIGVYPYFANTSDITILTEQNLVNMFTVNSVEIDLVAESGGNKQEFEIPDDWLSVNNLTKIEFFNPITGDFDEADQLSTFDQSPVNKTIEGNTVAYTKFTNNQNSRGSLRIKLIF